MTWLRRNWVYVALVAEFAVGCAVIYWKNGW